ncbi:MAG: helix-turn-helix transcriptional regulator, partial [Gammaproteobacteria bacterium]
MKTKDWVSLIEAGYDLEGNDRTWLEGVLAKATPLFDRGFWPIVLTYRFSATSVQFDDVVTGKGSRFIEGFFQNALKYNSRKFPESNEILFRGPGIVGSMSEWIFPKAPKDGFDKFLLGTGGRVRDIMGARAFTGIRSGMFLSVSFSEPVTPTPLERKRWPSAVAHLGAGLRLRSTIGKFSFDEAPVEAILDPGGKVHEAREEAAAVSAREILRNSVRRIEKARTAAGRSDPDDALANWEGLVQGRWSLVDLFDSDRRRFVVALKNDPAQPDPRGLSERERQVAEFVGLGRSSKEISYILGVSLSAVTNCTARVQAKLGLSSLTELAAFFAPGGARAKLAEISIAGEELLFGAYPLINENRVTSLTEAERAVLTHLLSGSTNDDIARRRKTSRHTVANQIQSIFDKLQVRSRGELAAR